MANRIDGVPHHPHAELCEKLIGEIAATFLKLLPDFEAKYGVDGYMARRLLGMALVTNGIDAMASGIEGNPPITPGQMFALRGLVVQGIERYWRENTQESGID